jgi:phosphoglycerate dehydrogenase-like enzyme
MRIVYWARLALARAAIIDRLQGLPGCDLVVADSLDAAVAALPGADGLVLYDAPRVDAQRIVDAINTPGSRLRWMHFVTAGRDGFDAVGLPPRPAISYAAGAVAPTVAEHAFALLLALGRRVPDMLAQSAQHRWDRSPATRTQSLEGRTMALIGTGHIGVQMAIRARAFGMHTVGLSRGARPDAVLDESLPLTQLHAVLARSDVIVAAVALTPETRHLLGRDAFAACKPGALLINVARGAVVDPAALGDALRSGRLGGAGLDVTDPEPLPPDDPLWDCPNVLISPHLGGSGSAASIVRLADGVLHNLQRLQAGQPLAGLVQPGHG